MIEQLNGVSSLVLNKVYHQLELEENCRYITTFLTHDGLFRYKRLGFGLSSAAEIFQHVIRQIIQPVTHAFNYSDDILVFGATRKEYDKALTQVCCLLTDADLTLNAKKCEFHKTKLNFFGHIFSEWGEDS